LVLFLLSFPPPPPPPLPPPPPPPPKQARTAEEAVEVVRRQTAELPGIARINDSGVRILHAARSLRKVAVGK
jgi:hypothetical protein